MIAQGRYLILKGFVARSGLEAGLPFSPESSKDNSDNRQFVRIRQPVLRSSVESSRNVNQLLFLPTILLCPDCYVG